MSVLSPKISITEIRRLGYNTTLLLSLIIIIVLLIVCSNKVCQHSRHFCDFISLRYFLLTSLRSIHLSFLQAPFQYKFDFASITLPSVQV